MTDRLIETITAPTTHRIDTVIKPSPLLGERSYAVIAACASVQNLPGCIVECGVAGGETAKALLDVTRGRKVVHLFDTFGTVPLAARNNLAAVAVNTHARSVDEVKAVLRPWHHDAEFHVGLFKDTLPLWNEAHCRPSDCPLTLPVSFLHADGDLYESTCDIIAFARHHVVQHGVVVFDDYGTEWTGVTKAVDERLPEGEWFTYVVEGVGQLVAVRR